MPVVNFDGTEEGVHELGPKTEGKTEGPASQAGHAAMAMLQRGGTDPAVYATFLRQHPELRQNLLGLLHRRFGNTFVMTVLDNVDRDQSVAPVADAQASAGEPAKVPNASAASGRASSPEGGHGERKAPAGVDGMVSQGLDHFDPAQLPKGDRPVSNGERRAGMIAGIKGMRDGLFSAMDRGVTRAEAATEERDKPPHVKDSTLLSILGDAVSSYWLAAMPRQRSGWPTRSWVREPSRRSSSQKMPSKK